MTNLELRASLKALGISQKWLAERLGVSTATVFRWVRGDLSRGDFPVPQYVVAYLELMREFAAELAAR
jgi:predicted transcriptional regulator